MAFLTVTPESLRQLAATCEREAGAIGNVQTSVGQNVTSVDWDSPAAKQFKGEWESTHKVNLQKLMEALNALGATAKSMAANYEQADQSYRGAT